MVAYFLALLMSAAGGMPVEINSPAVRTVKLENPDSFMAPPVIRLSTNDHLRLNYDMIGEDKEYLRYRLVHCDADWRPSRLLQQEFTAGFNEDEVDDCAFSTNTFVHYTNYNIPIPSDDLAPSVSGNYLLQMFREDNPDEVLLQTGFYVSENTVGIRGEATPRTDKGFNSEYQQVELEIDLANEAHINPWQDLKVVVVQNNSPHAQAVSMHPLRVEGSVATFSHDPNFIFPAGNEYRRFETVRTDYPGMNVDSISHSGKIKEAYLKTDEPRLGKGYEYDNTQHGRFKIDEYNSTDPDLGADYVVTHFSLKIPEQVGREIYVDGELTGNRLSEQNRMAYNREKAVYELSLPLKQGSYNYRYIMTERDSLNPSLVAVDGNHYETSNEYLVLVYIRTPGSRADRLVGATVF